MDLHALEVQKGSYGVLTPLDVLLQTFVDCFEETAEETAYSFTLVALAEPAHSLLLCLELLLCLCK